MSVLDCESSVEQSVEDLFRKAVEYLNYASRHLSQPKKFSLQKWNYRRKP